MRTAYLAVTRGDGGQNLIGAELGSALGLIRTHELLSARRIDGGEQMFTRAIDFGYSKTPEETFRVWGREEVLRDVVRVVRTFRPDVVVARFPENGRRRPRPPHRVGDPRARGLPRRRRPDALPRADRGRSRPVEAPPPLLECLAARRQADRGRDPVRAGRLQPPPRPVVHRDRGREPEPAQEPGVRLVGAARPADELPRPPRGGAGRGRPVRGDRHLLGARAGRRACRPSPRRGGTGVRPQGPRRRSSEAPRRPRGDAGPAARPVGRGEARRAPRRDPLGLGPLARGDGGEPVGDAGERVPARRHGPRPRGRRRDSRPGRRPVGRRRRASIRGRDEAERAGPGLDERPGAGRRRGDPAALAPRETRPGPLRRPRAARRHPARRRGAPRRLRDRPRRGDAPLRRAGPLPEDRPGEGGGDPALRRRAASDGRPRGEGPRPPGRPAARRQGDGPHGRDSGRSHGPAAADPFDRRLRDGRRRQAGGGAPEEGRRHRSSVGPPGVARRARRPPVLPRARDERDVRVHASAARGAGRRDALGARSSRAGRRGASRSAGSSTRTCRR